MSQTAGRSLPDDDQRHAPDAVPKAMPLADGHEPIFGAATSMEFRRLNRAERRAHVEAKNTHSTANNDGYQLVTASDATASPLFPPMQFTSEPI